ncbi:MAG TPA: nucleotidyltransferase domain-containing protein [Gammaproteobacteria bacterium]|jgi:predicted nucleotidyltransferase
MGIDAAAKESIPSRRQSLADALFTSTQQRLLGLLFGQPKRSFFVTELIGLAGAGRGAVQRELSRLEHSGLVSMEKRGNQKYYRANPSASIYKELCSIVRKTVGLQETIRAALEPLDKRIAVALIYGSVAKRADTAKSDIDLLVVADDMTLEELYAYIEPAEKLLGRAINPTLHTKKEFRSRRKSRNAFLKRVLDGPTILLRGVLDVA